MAAAAEPTIALRLAVILFLVPLAYIAAFVAFSYATADITDGRWAARMTEYLQTLDPDTLGLLGAHSRFVWSGLAVLFPLIMISAGGFALVVIARQAAPFRTAAVGAFVILAVAVAAVAWTLGPRQLSSCLLVPCGSGCVTESTGELFLIIPYMAGVFCGIYGESFVSFFLGFFSLAGPVQIAVTILTYAAAVSLVLSPRSAGPATTAELRQRNAAFRLLLVFASAMLTLTGIMELTLWGWLAEIAAEWDHALKLRSLQAGSALYWGLCNSALLLLVFVPLGSLLARQARTLAEAHNEGATLPALETWEREHGVTLMGRGAWPQVTGIIAPLLPGALAFLFQSALGGG